MFDISAPKNPNFNMQEDPVLFLRFKPVYYKAPMRVNLSMPLSNRGAGRTSNFDDFVSNNESIVNKI
jgi:hypothetical protein